MSLDEHLIELEDQHLDPNLPHMRIRQGLRALKAIYGMLWLLADCLYADHPEVSYEAEKACEHVARVIHRHGGFLTPPNTEQRRYEIYDSSGLKKEFWHDTTIQAGIAYERAMMTQHFPEEIRRRRKAYKDRLRGDALTAFTASELPVGPGWMA